MDRNERSIIDDLFARLREAEQRSGPRDAEAEEAIREHAAAQPAVPYYMAQAIVVQQEALKTTQGRIQDLERQLAERPAGGGFLSGLFGGAEDPAQPATARDVRPARAAGPWGAPAGGGFLAGAAQTALGVAGGVLIADALADMFGAGEATAAELPADEAAADEPAGELPPDEDGDGFDSDLGVDTDGMDFDF